MGFARIAAGVALALCIAGAGAADSTETPDIAALCARQACRTGGYDAVVGVDAQRFTTIPVTHSPYLIGDGAILIFPGETISVTFAGGGGTLGAPVSAMRYAPQFPALIVKDGAAPEANPEDAGLAPLKGEMPNEQVAALPPNTLVISYGQFGPKGSTGMVLKLEHNMPHAVKLNLVISEISPGAYRQHDTSSCPVQPKMFDDESWPNALGPLILTKARFLPDGGTTMICQ